MLESRTKKMRVVEKLLKVAKQHQYELSEYGLHSDLNGLGKINRVLTEVVVLLQEKNLLIEVSGKKNFVKVGVKERQLDWPVNAKKPMTIDPNDFYSKKLRREIEEQKVEINKLDKESEVFILLNKEMKAFISAVFGNDDWIRIAEATWKRMNQPASSKDYNTTQHTSKLYGRSAFKPHVPQMLIDELPTHLGDQFGQILERNEYYHGPTVTQQDIYARLNKRKRIQMRAKGRSVARNALLGRNAVTNSKYIRTGSIGVRSNQQLG